MKTPRYERTIFSELRGGPNTNIARFTAANLNQAMQQGLEQGSAMMRMAAEAQSKTAATAAVQSHTWQRNEAGQLVFPDLPRTDGLVPRLYDVEYKQQMLQAYGQRLHIDAKNTAADIAAKHQFDPEGFSQAYGAWAEATLEGIPEQYRHDFSIIADSVKAQSYAHIADVTAKRDHADARALLQHSVSLAGEDIYTIASATGAGAVEAQAELSTAYERLNAAYQNRTINQAEFEQKLSDLESAAIAGAVKHSVSNITGENTWFSVNGAAVKRAEKYEAFARGEVDLELPYIDENGNVSSRVVKGKNILSDSQRRSIADSLKKEDAQATAVQLARVEHNEQAHFAAYFAEATRQQEEIHRGTREFIDPKLHEAITNILPGVSPNTRENWKSLHVMIEQSNLYADQFRATLATLSASQTQVENYIGANAGLAERINVAAGMKIFTTNPDGTWGWADTDLYSEADVGQTTDPYYNISYRQAVMQQALRAIALIEENSPKRNAAFEKMVGEIGEKMAALKTLESEMSELYGADWMSQAPAVIQFERRRNNILQRPLSLNATSVVAADAAVAEQLGMNEEEYETFWQTATIADVAKSWDAIVFHGFLPKKAVNFLRGQLQASELEPSELAALTSIVRRARDIPAMWKNLDSEHQLGEGYSFILNQLYRSDLSPSEFKTLQERIKSGVTVNDYNTFVAQQGSNWNTIQNDTNDAINEWMDDMGFGGNNSTFHTMLLQDVTTEYVMANGNLDLEESVKLNGERIMNNGGWSASWRALPFDALLGEVDRVQRMVSGPTPESVYQGAEVYTQDGGVQAEIQLFDAEVDKILRSQPALGGRTKLGRDVFVQYDGFDPEEGHGWTFLYRADINGSPEWMPLTVAHPKTGHQVRLVYFQKQRGFSMVGDDPFTAQPAP